MVKDNLARVRDRIKRAAEKAGRDPEDIRLIAVTKEASAIQMREVVEAGVTDIGENRVKEAVLKSVLLNSRVLTWHMIGHLQSNKARNAVKIFSLIHSIDSMKLADTVNREAGKQNKVQDVLIEVNTSGEKSKFGITPENLGRLLEEARRLKNIRILGLMTMAPFAPSAEAARPYFKRLKMLGDEYKLKELSMGMTQDFEVAVEEGATMVRIGSAIFKGAT